MTKILNNFYASCPETEEMLGKLISDYEKKNQPQPIEPKKKKNALTHAQTYKRILDFLKTRTEPEPASFVAEKTKMSKQRAALFLGKLYRMGAVKRYTRGPQKFYGL